MSDQFRSMCIMVSIASVLFILQFLFALLGISPLWVTAVIFIAFLGLAVFTYLEIKPSNVGTIYLYNLKGCTMALLGCFSYSLVLPVSEPTVEGLIVILLFVSATIALFAKAADFFAQPTWARKLAKQQGLVYYRNTFAGERLFRQRRILRDFFNSR